jgi:cytochrome c oxidase subunit 2
LRILLGVAMAASILAACGGSSGTAPDGPAARGAALVEDRGCVACHGADGGGGVGPSWIGLADSEVTLDDGTVVIADDEYLRRSIAEPDAEVVEGFAVQMPANDLTESEIDDVIAYLETL